MTATSSTSWLSQRACRDEDPNIFYGCSTHAALAICAGCPVKGECLAQALSEELVPHEVYGVRGGLGVTTRRRLVAANARQRRHVAQCGTESGYRAHTRNNEEHCAACRKAHADAEALRQRRHRDRLVVEATGAAFPMSAQLARPERIQNRRAPAVF